MKIILLPVDFSERSKQLAEEAIAHLGKEEGESRVVLLNTYRVPQAPYPELLKAHDEERKKSLEALEGEARRMKALTTHSKISFETVLFMGSLKNVLIHVTETRKIDYLVWGAGNQLEKGLLDRLKCRIMLIPPPSTPTEKNSDRNKEDL